MREPRRWLAVGGAGLAAAVLLAAATVLVTDVGIPEDPYSSPPDPCELLGDQTLRELVGDTWSPRRADRSEATGIGLGHRAELRRCELDGPATDDGSLQVDAYWFSSTQFNLGPDGVERAGEQFEAFLAMSREASQRDCSFEAGDDRTDACGFGTGRDLQLHLRRENLYLEITGDARGDRPLEEVLAALTDQVLSRLDQPA